MQHATITVPADPDADDCLAAAEAAYLDEHPSLAGYDLDPQWGDDNRETVVLTVPAWHLEPPRDLEDEAACRGDYEYDRQRDDALTGDGR